MCHQENEYNVFFCVLFSIYSKWMKRTEHTIETRNNNDCAINDVNFFSLPLLIDGGMRTLKTNMRWATAHNKSALMASQSKPIWDVYFSLCCFALIDIIRERHNLKLCRTATGKIHLLSEKYFAKLFFFWILIDLIFICWTIDNRKARFFYDLRKYAKINK